MENWLKSLKLLKLREVEACAAGSLIDNCTENKTLIRSHSNDGKTKVIDLRKISNRYPSQKLCANQCERNLRARIAKISLLRADIGKSVLEKIPIDDEFQDSQFTKDLECQEDQLLNFYMKHLLYN